MAAFTYQHPTPFHLDPLFFPNTPFYMSDLILDEEQVDTNIPTCCFPSSSSSSVHHPPLDEQLQTEMLTNTDSSSTIVDHFEGGSDQIINTQQEITPMEKKKRKNRDGSSFSSAQSTKDVNKRAKPRTQKKCSVGNIQVTEELINKCKTDNKKKKKNQKKGLDEAEDNPPTGYVHVRARRGEATDSHSLAERVRREKISERLKLLQSFVPGCDKVTSKAVMLDEIINYVQSLQFQVEFLSMKLASVNPAFYDFGVDLDAFMVKSEKPSNLASPMLLPCLEQSIPNAPTDMVDISTTPSTANNFSASLQQQQRPNDFSAQENGDHHQLWHVGNQRTMLINQLGATNIFMASAAIERK